ncbi:MULTISPECIES: hypothetical protein [Gordonibacter]|uniref:hypothetical protein n=1 Tax=Gordonibacter TaxID=644652 RepID=UPI000F4BDB8F|nr:MULTISPECIES: hypothetical protein [Gordonibacter]MDN4469100.1 hypothetical protein [Gordonibacter sp. RACS_AR68]ROT92862.1 hypothetical protein DMP13_00905 [Gordonibacter urolithinfaciens]GKG89130.1 hypothetical protein CE91St32_01720 [Gordonibacter pamelaeae]
MKYEVVIEDMATEDLSDLLLYKTAFTHSVSRAKEQLSNLVMTAAKTYRSSPIGMRRKPADSPMRFGESARSENMRSFIGSRKIGRVLIERFAHTKADFNRIHFGN